MYKLNQDHIELFFSSVRSRLGYNNNPTVRQFLAAFRQLLIHCQIRDGGIGNCIPLENIQILNCSPIAAINNSTERIIMIEDTTDETNSFPWQPSLLDHDYSDIVHHGMMNPTSLNIYCEKIVEYIAGFIVFKLKKRLHCLDCLAAIEGNLEPNSLTAYKTIGYLKNPSKSVVSICEIVERELKKVMLELDPNEILISKKVHQSIIIQVKRRLIDRNLFCDKFDHFANTDHYGFLVKLIIDKYLNVRFHHISKTQSEKDSVRNLFNRLILFRNM